MSHVGPREDLRATEAADTSKPRGEDRVVTRARGRSSLRAPARRRLGASISHPPPTSMVPPAEGAGPRVARKSARRVAPLPSAARLLQPGSGCLAPAAWLPLPGSRCPAPASPCRSAASPTSSCAAALVPAPRLCGPSRPGAPPAPPSPRFAPRFPPRAAAASAPARPLSLRATSPRATSPRRLRAGG